MHPHHAPFFKKKLHPFAPSSNIWDKSYLDRSLAEILRQPVTEWRPLNIPALTKVRLKVHGMATYIDHRV